MKWWKSCRFTTTYLKKRLNMNLVGCLRSRNAGFLDVWPLQYLESRRVLSLEIDAELNSYGHTEYHMNEQDRLSKQFFDEQ